MITIPPIKTVTFKQNIQKPNNKSQIQTSSFLGNGVSYRSLFEGCDAESLCETESVSNNNIDFNKLSLEQKINFLYHLIGYNNHSILIPEETEVILIGRHFDTGLKVIKDKNFQYESVDTKFGVANFVYADIPNYILIKKDKPLSKIIPAVYNVKGNTTIFNNNGSSIPIPEGRTPCDWRVSSRLDPFSLPSYSIGNGDNKLFTIPINSPEYINKGNLDKFKELYKNRNISGVQKKYINIDYFKPEPNVEFRRSHEWTSRSID